MRPESSLNAVLLEQTAAAGRQAEPVDPDTAVTPWPPRKALGGDLLMAWTIRVMADPIEIVDYDPAWPAEFAAIGKTLREALGDIALRVDHIGSTSVPGLAAKPVFDIQISVRALDPLDAYKPAMERLGLVHRAGNPELTKRYFREAPGSRRTHIHVGELGSFSQQLPLLFRDYLRAHPGIVEVFAQAKRRCARDSRDDRQQYVSAKEPFVWDIVRRADLWAQGIGWRPGPTDA